MITFKQAQRRHAMVRQTLDQAVNNGRDRKQVEDVASSIWSGVVGAGKAGDVISHAVADTTPREYATPLATESMLALVHKNR